MRRNALSSRARCSRSSSSRVLELSRHLVELLAERGELVAAGDRHRRREVAAAQPPRGLQEATDLLLQRARHEHRESERDEQEAAQDGRPRAAGGYRRETRVSDRLERIEIAQRHAAEARRVVGGDAVVDRARAQVPERGQGPAGGKSEARPGGRCPG